MAHCTCVFCSDSCEQETATTYHDVLCGKDFSWPEEMAKQFPNWNNPENKCWNITLIGKDARSEAPLIGVVNNHFAGAQVHRGEHLWRRPGLGRRARSLFVEVAGQELRSMELYQQYSPGKQKFHILDGRKWKAHTDFKGPLMCLQGQGYS